MPKEKKLPQYSSTVGALKIAEVREPQDEDGAATGEPGLQLVFEEEGHDPVVVPPDYVTTHNPHPGGYYTEVDDVAGFAEADAFESTYKEKGGGKPS